MKKSTAYISVAVLIIFTIAIYATSLAKILPCERTPVVPNPVSFESTCSLGEWSGFVKSIGTGSDITAVGNILATLILLVLIALVIYFIKAKKE